MWIDIACILFTCVCMNHLGLIESIEGVVRFPLYVINCPKCSSHWFTLIYCLFFAHTSVIGALAISFLVAYLATWLELGMGIIDLLYTRIYENYFKSKGDDDSYSATDESNGDT